MYFENLDILAVELLSKDRSEYFLELLLYRFKYSESKILEFMDNMDIISNDFQCWFYWIVIVGIEIRFYILLWVNSFPFSFHHKILHFHSKTLCQVHDVFLTLPRVDAGLPGQQKVHHLADCARIRVRDGEGEGVMDCCNWETGHYLPD